MNYDFSFKDILLILFIAFLVMSYITIPSSERAIDLVKKSLIKTDEYGREIKSESLEKETYADGGISFTRCLGKPASFARVVKTSSAKYYVCSEYMGKDIIKK